MIMRKALKLMPLMLMVLLLTACDKGKSGSVSEATAFAFMDEDEKWGLMDAEGNVIVEPEYDMSPTVVQNGVFFVRNFEDHVFELYSVGDKPKLIGKYKDVGGFAGELCPVVNKKGVLEYIDNTGEARITLKKIKGKEVTSGYDFFDGCALVVAGEKYGFINSNGDVIVPCKYSDGWSFSDGLAILYDSDGYEDENGKWSVVDTEGNVLFTKKFKDMKPSSFSYKEGLLPVKLSNDRLALIDREGNIVKKLKAISLSSEIIDGKFVFYDEDEEKYGLMTTEGEVLLRAKYETLNYNGKFLVGSLNNEDYYKLSFEGEKLFKFDGYPYLFGTEVKGYDKAILVSVGDGYILVDGEGNEVETQASSFNSYDVTWYWSCNTDFELNGGDEWDEDFDGDPEEYYEEEADSIY